MSGRLDGKVALITGGTSGIGEATVRLFVQEGARVVLTGRDETKGNAIATDLGGSARFFRADVTREEDIEASVAFATREFGQVDVLVAPVIPEPAPPLAHATEGPVHELGARQGRFSRLTRPFNGLGLPALSVPCGFSSAGLPLAFQIVGRPFDEATALRVGDAYQQATDWHTRRPPLD